MHNPWEEMIPFYIAGTLPKMDSTRLETHLTRCKECQTSLREWRDIADAVRAEAARQLLRDLPPLSSQVVRAAHASGRRYTPALTTPPRRYTSLPVTMVAAILTIVVFGGLLALMVLRNNQPPNATGVVVQPTNTSGIAIIVVEESSTPTFFPTNTPSPIPPTQLVIPTRVNPTSDSPVNPNLPLGTPLPNGMGGGSDAQTFMLVSTCVLHAALDSANLHAGPDESYPVINTFTPLDELTVLAQSDNGWYQGEYTFAENRWVGWVRQELVYTSGECANLTVIAAADYQPNTPEVTPTPVVEEPAVMINYPSVILRSGPSTDYPLIAGAQFGDRFHVEAQSTNDNEVWYLISAFGRAAWVSSTVVELQPANAPIPPAVTIPPPPAPTDTPTPLPTLPVTSGTWNQTSTIMAHECGGTVGTSSTMLVLITYSGDSLTLLYSGTGTAVPLVRTTGLTYIGSYTTTSASVSVRLSFLSPTLYNGDEVITHESGCVVRSSWTGTYSGR